MRVVVAGRLGAGVLLPWWLPHISPIHACARPVTACNYTVIQNSEPLCSTFSCHTNSMVVERPTSHTSRVTRSKVAPRLHVLADKGAHCHRRAGSQVGLLHLYSFRLQLHHLCANSLLPKSHFIDSNFTFDCTLTCPLHEEGSGWQSILRVHNKTP